MTCVLELEMEHAVETCHTHAQPKGAVTQTACA